MSTRHEKVIDLTAGELPRGRFFELVTRVFNFVAAAAGLVVLSPLFLVVAVLIRLGSPGPVLYRGKRVGRNEKIFTIYKFRTLEQGAETMIGARLLRDGEEHVTPIGRRLRKRKIDEFPQLINVLKGDMNLVGPRPVRPVFIEDAKASIPGYADRFKITPGITGLAQLRHSYYLSPKNKLRFERIYMKNRSVLFDLWIILLTFTRLLSRQMTALSLFLLHVVFALFLPQGLSSQLEPEIMGRPFSLLNLAILGMGILFVARYLRGDLVFLKTPVDRVILGYLMVASGAVLLQSASGGELLILLKFACTGFGLYYFVANSVNERADEMTSYMKGIAVIAFFSGVAGVAGFILLRGEVRSETLRATLDARLVTDFITNRNVLLSYFVLCLPVMLAATRGFKSLAWKAAGLAAFAASIAVAAGCFSKRGMLVLGVTLFLYGWRQRRERATQVLAAALLLVRMGHALVTGNPPWDLEMPISRAQEQVSLQAAVLREHAGDLFLGSGEASWRFVDVPETVESRDKLLPPVGMNNMYLTILLKYGIIALFLMISVLVGVLRTLYHGSLNVREPLIREFLWAILCGAVGILVNLFFFDAFRSTSVQIPFWIFTGLGMGMALKFGPQRREYYRLWHYQH